MMSTARNRALRDIPKRGILKRAESIMMKRVESIMKASMMILMHSMYMPRIMKRLVKWHLNIRRWRSSRDSLC